MTASDAQVDTEIHLTRKGIDKILVAIGTLFAAVLFVAGGLLMWGSNFAGDYVGKELRSQNISFPAAEELTTEGRTDLVHFAGQQVVNGEQAQGYASFINGHLQGIADGKTYADLGDVVNEAKAAVQTAKDQGQPQSAIDELQAKVTTLNGQRDTLFKGETLRGLLLSAYAWSTVGRIAGIAAWAALAAGVVMVVLVVLGIVHQRKAGKAVAKA
ncbi:MAG: hypothetical protein QM733_05005 [Ilumatobacteraceae bacterium]